MSRVDEKSANEFYVTWKRRKYWLFGTLRMGCARDNKVGEKSQGTDI